MTKVPQGFDCSFLNDEEARKILRVLERNEELQRAEKDRISKLQKTKRDIRWLQGVTGEWFEEIQRKKFCNETDVSQMLKQPLTYRLRKEMAENDPTELQTSRSKNMTTPNQRNPTSVPSRLTFRSSFSSLFSFRKSRKETSKLPSLDLKGCDGHAELPESVRGNTMQAKLYNSHLENQPVDSAFVPKPAGMREGSGMPPWDPSLLENEFFQVLDDLDNKLAQEQSQSPVNSRTPLNYGSRTPFSHVYTSGNRHGTITGRHKNHYTETSNMSIYDILRPGTPREGFKTFSPRTRTICDMYRTREPRVFKEDYVQKNVFGSSSLCFDSKQRLASPATGHFTARSLHFPATTQNKSGFVPSRQQSPKRTPLSSIIWNRSDSSRERQSQEESLTAPSPMEIDPADQYMYPRCFQDNRRYEFYHSQHVYHSVSLNTPTDNAMSPDPFENSENMPFYHQADPFARSFFSNTFGRSREQRFGLSPFWGQQEEHSSWSGVPQSSQPFPSDTDFEMISTEANCASAGYGHCVSTQHWGSFSPSYRTNIPRDQEEPHPWQFDSQTSTLENMEVSKGNGNQITHFSTPDVGSMTDSSYHIKSVGLECQHDSAPIEVSINKEPYSFGIVQPQASSFKTSFPQIPDNKGNSQSPSFQNSTVTLQKIKPASLPIRNYTEVSRTKNDLVDSSPLTESQANILITEVNNEKDLNESVLEKDKQLNKVDHTNTTSEISQPVSQSIISNSLPDFQNSFSQDSAKSNKFAFSAATAISSKKSSGVTSMEGISTIHRSQREKTNELKEGKSYTENRKPGSATSLSFIQESRTPPSFPSPNQGCHPELRTSNKDISSIIEHSHWSSKPTDNKNIQSSEMPAIVDNEEEQCTNTHSTNCSKSAAGQNLPCDSLSLLSGIPPNCSPSNNSFPNAPVVPSTTVFAKKTSGKDPSWGERDKKDNDSKNQSNHLAPSPSDNQNSDDSCVLTQNDVVIKCHSHPPFRAGKVKGKIRQRISCIEKLSNVESKSSPTSDSRSFIDTNESDSMALDHHTIYCTLPRRAGSFLITNRKSEGEIMASSFSTEPLPLQIQNNVEDPVGKGTSNTCSPSSSASESSCSKVASDPFSVASETTDRMTSMTKIGSASVREGPPPFLTKRAVSCPPGVPCASVGRDEREKCLISDTDAFALTPRPWEKPINPLESNSSVRDCSLTRRPHPKEYLQECTEKGDKIATSRKDIFSISNEDPLPSSDMSGEKSGKTLHKFKTTSLFSVSGDEDHMKCLEVVSMYYTLPRKHSKSFCNLLQEYTQNTSPRPESAKVGTETFSNTLDKDKLYYSTQEQSGARSSEDLKGLVSSAQENSCDLSHNTENVTGLQLPSLRPSELPLQKMASIETEVSHHKGESKTREISPNNLAKTHLGHSQNRKKRGKQLQCETLPILSMFHGGKVTEDKSEHCQKSVKSSNSGPSSLPAHSEEKIENPQTRRSSRECAGSGISMVTTGSRKCLQKGMAGIAKDDGANRLQPRRVKGETGADFPKQTNKSPSDSESQVFALAPALCKLQLDEETCLGEQDFDGLRSEPRELPPRILEVNLTENTKAKDEIQRWVGDQQSLPAGSNKNKTSWDGLDKAKNRSSGKHRWAAMSKASRNFPAKDGSPRKHVATIFPQSEDGSGSGGLSLGTPECHPVSSEPTPKSTQPTEESRQSHDAIEVGKCENPLQVSEASNREASPNSMSQLICENELRNIPKSPPKHENSKEVTVAQILERESRTLAQPTLGSLREAGFSDHQRRLTPHSPWVPAEKSTLSIPPASGLQQQRSGASPAWSPEPHPYRSKSLKNLSVHGDLLRKSHPPKARERHFSESTSMDNALSPLPIGTEFSDNHECSRRFKSFSEFSSCDENESWTLYSGRTKTRPKSATSISRPIDYGIFGKEQQLALLENVKRSLTQGRLWKPSFLKNPGFLKDDVISPPNPTESSSSNSPHDQMPEDGSSPHVPLNIYEEDPVDSDCDTDTTTDDEYYLDENDKESEL